MEMFGNIRCVTFAELVTQGGILSEPNYKKKVKEKKIRVVQSGGNGRKVLIDYVSLYRPIKEAYDIKYPEAEKELKEQIKKESMSDVLRTDSKAIEYYRDKFTLTDGSSLTDVKQAEYVLNAQVMNEMIRVDGEMRSRHSKNGYSHPKDVWETVLGTCEKLRENYKHTLPMNAARLREKYNAYKKHGYEVLVSRKNGNQTARKIGAMEARLLLKLKRSKFPIYTDYQIFEEYNRLALISQQEAELSGNFTKALNPIKSMTTLRNYLNEPAVMPLWFSAVYGMQKWKSKYSSLMKTQLPQMRDALWYSDGTKLNLYYKNADNKMCTTSVYEVMDAYSETFLGYDIAPHETFDNQYRALRNAVEFAGVRPYEIVTDNQGGHSKLAAQGFFDKIAILHKPTMPYNGQSKTIESAFGRLQQQILHKIWYFTGQNVVAKKLNSKPNIEFIEQNAYALPTLEEVKEIYRQCREEWNNAAHPSTGISRVDMYRMSENPETTPVQKVDIIQMFWLTSANEVTYTNSGLKIEINKQKYEYEVYGEDGLRNEEWALRNIGRKFRVMYDPMDMTGVELWEVTASGLKYSMKATPRVVISRATQERTTEETSFMRRAIDQNKETMALIQLSTEDFDLSEAIAAELFGLSTPKPKNVSKKKMDSVREKYEAGKLKAPISLPEKLAMEEQSEDMELEYSTTGEYTKVTSNLTFEDIRRLEQF